MKLFLHAGIYGGLNIEVRLDNGATEVITKEQFEQAVDGLKDEYARSKDMIAWLNNDEQMVDGHGTVYERAPRRKERHAPATRNRRGRA